MKIAPTNFFAGTRTANSAPSLEQILMGYGLTTCDSEGNENNSDFFSKNPSALLTESSLGFQKPRFLLEKIPTPIQPSISGLFPHVIALEQMRLRAIEQLEFDRDQIQKSWWNTDGGVQDQREEYQRQISRVNEGIDALVFGIINGKARSVEDAFHKAAELPGFLGNGARLSGEAFKNNLLKNSHVDVDALLKISKCRDAFDLERGLLDYTKSLRKNFGSLDGYPFRTIVTNLMALSHASNGEVRNEASLLLQEVSGETTFSGMTDEKWAQVLRDGSRGMFPVVVAGLFAAPLGALLEGTAAGIQFTVGGRTLWSGANAAGQVGLLARGIGVAGESTIFWATHDALHSTFLGGGDYFTGRGWAKSLLMLGGLKVVMGSFQSMVSPWMNDAHLAAKALIPAGAFLTEWAAFFGLGQLEQLLKIVPVNDSPLRQEIIEAGIGLLQLKTGMKLGAMASGELSSAWTIRIKLDTAGKLFEKAREQGQLTREACASALEQIFGMQMILNQVGGMQPAFSLAGEGPNLGEALRPVDSKPMEARGKGSGNGGGAKKALAEPSRGLTLYDGPKFPRQFFFDLSVAVSELKTGLYAGKSENDISKQAYLAFTLKLLGKIPESEEIFARIKSQISEAPATQGRSEATPRIKSLRKQISNLSRGDWDFDFTGEDMFLKVDGMMAQGDWEGALALARERGDIRSLAFITMFFSRLMPGVVEARQASFLQNPMTVSLKLQAEAIGMPQISVLLSLVEYGSQKMQSNLSLAAVALIDLQQAAAQNQPTDFHLLENAREFMETVERDLTGTPKADDAIGQLKEFMRGLEKNYPPPVDPSAFVVEFQKATLQWARIHRTKIIRDLSHLNKLGYLGYTLKTLGKADEAHLVFKVAREVLAEGDYDFSPWDPENPGVVLERLDELEQGRLALSREETHPVYSQLHQLMQRGEWGSALKWGLENQGDPEILAIMVQALNRIKRDDWSPSSRVDRKSVSEALEEEALFWGIDEIPGILRKIKGRDLRMALPAIVAVLETLKASSLGQGEIFNNYRPIAHEQLDRLATLITQRAQKEEIEQDDARNALDLIGELRKKVFSMNPRDKLAPPYPISGFDGAGEGEGEPN